MVCRTAFRRKSNIGPVGPTANHQQGWWFVTYDFIDENRELMGEWDGAWHCLLVTGENTGDGVLVQSEGSSYARYSAFVPSVSGLIVQEKCEKYGHRENAQTKGYSQQIL